MSETYIEQRVKRGDLMLMRVKFEYIDPFASPTKMRYAIAISLKELAVPDDYSCDVFAFIDLGDSIGLIYEKTDGYGDDYSKTFERKNTRVSISTETLNWEFVERYQSEIVGDLGRVNTDFEWILSLDELKLKKRVFDKIGLYWSPSKETEGSAKLSFRDRVKGHCSPLINWTKRPKHFKRGDRIVRVLLGKADVKTGLVLRINEMFKLVVIDVDICHGKGHSLEEIKLGKQKRMKIIEICKKRNWLAVSSCHDGIHIYAKATDEWYELIKQKHKLSVRISNVIDLDIFTSGVSDNLDLICLPGTSVKDNEDIIKKYTRNGKTDWEMVNEETRDFQEYISSWISGDWSSTIETDPFEVLNELKYLKSVEVTLECSLAKAEIQRESQYIKRVSMNADDEICSRIVECIGHIDCKIGKIKHDWWEVGNRSELPLLPILFAIQSLPTKFIPDANLNLYKNPNISHEAELHFNEYLYYVESRMERKKINFNLNYLNKLLSIYASDYYNQFVEPLLNRPSSKFEFVEPIDLKDPDFTYREFKRNLENGVYRSKSALAADLGRIIRRIETTKIFAIKTIDKSRDHHLDRIKRREGYMYMLETRKVSEIEHMLRNANYEYESVEEIKTTTKNGVETTKKITKKVVINAWNAYCTYESQFFIKGLVDFSYDPNFLQRKGGYYYSPDMIPLEKVNMELVGIWTGLIERMLKPEQSKYVINVVKYIYRYFEKKADVIIVLYGKDGCGKGSFMQVILNIFRGYSFEVCGVGELVGEFNSVKEGMKVGHIDEAEKNGKTEQIFKNLSTSKQTRVRHMYNDAYTTQNKLTLFVSTNELDSMVIRRNTDRRNAIFECSDELCGHTEENDAYFDNYYRTIEKDGSPNPEFYYHLSSWLFNSELDKDFDCRKFVKTEAQIANHIEYRERLMDFVQDNLEDFERGMLATELTLKLRQFKEDEDDSRDTKTLRSVLAGYGIIERKTKADEQAKLGFSKQERIAIFNSTESLEKFKKLIIGEEVYMVIEEMEKEKK